MLNFRNCQWSNHALCWVPRCNARRQTGTEINKQTTKKRQSADSNSFLSFCKNSRTQSTILFWPYSTACATTLLSKRVLQTTWWAALRNLIELLSHFFFLITFCSPLQGVIMIADTIKLKQIGITNYHTIYARDEQSMFQEFIMLVRRWAKH